MTDDLPFSYPSSPTPTGARPKRRPGGPTVIDLSVDAFARLAPPSRGLVEVTVTW